MKLTIKNQTDYDTRALRCILKRAAEEVGCKQDKCVRVAYSNRGVHWGRAWIGSRRYENPHSLLTVPNENIDPVQFARVARHEFMHNLGVRHGDMTEEQRYCTAGGEWAKGIAIPKKAPKPKVPKVGAPEKREARARSMLKRTEERIIKLTRQLALAEKNLKKWQRKVRYYEKKKEK